MSEKLKELEQVEGLHVTDFSGEGISSMGIVVGEVATRQINGGYEGTVTYVDKLDGNKESVVNWSARPGSGRREVLERTYMFDISPAPTSGRNGSFTTSPQSEGFVRDQIMEALAMHYPDIPYTQ